MNAKIIRVSPHYRINRSYLDLRLVDPKDGNAMPGIKLKPGMKLQISICDNEEKIKTRKWDTIDCLKTGEDIVNYLEAAMEDGYPDVIKIAVKNVIRKLQKTETTSPSENQTRSR